MRRSSAVCLLACAVCATGLAQQWEVGGAGGVGIHTDATVRRNDQQADAGFKSGAAFSAFAAQNLYERLSGEFRYTFQFNDLKLAAAGTETTFAGQSHAIHYDLHFLTRPRGASVRPYLLGGGGIKVYRGTGREQVTQPLAEFAILTRTQEVEGLVTFGGGVRVRASRHVIVRAEVRDYLTRVPTQVIAPVPGARLNGWMHNIVPMLGLSFGID